MQFFQKNKEQSNRDLNSYNTKDEDFSQLLVQFILSPCTANMLIAPLICVKVNGFCFFWAATNQQTQRMTF